jgi:hypothetical protein
MQKTSEERRQVKLMKSIHKQKMSGSTFTPYESNTRFPLIIYMKRSPRVEAFKSTHSYMCYRSNIQELLDGFKDKGYIINKVYFNNKLYKHE